jgi:hypothetical protein
MTREQEKEATLLLQILYETMVANNDREDLVSQTYSLLTELGHHVQPVEWDDDEFCFRVIAPMDAA